MWITLAGTPSAKYYYSGSVYHLPAPSAAAIASADAVIYFGAARNNNASVITSMTLQLNGTPIQATRVWSSGIAWQPHMIAAIVDASSVTNPSTFSLVTDTLSGLKTSFAWQSAIPLAGVDIRSAAFLTTATASTDGAITLSASCAITPRADGAVLAAMFTTGGAAVAPYAPAPGWTPVDSGLGGYPATGGDNTPGGYVWLDDDARPDQQLTFEATAQTTMALAQRLVALVELRGRARYIPPSSPSVVVVGSASRWRYATTGSIAHCGWTPPTTSDLQTLIVVAGQTASGVRSASIDVRWNGTPLAITALSSTTGAVSAAVDHWIAAALVESVTTAPGTISIITSPGYDLLGVDVIPLAGADARRLYRAAETKIAASDPSSLAVSVTPRGHGQIFALNLGTRQHRGPYVFDPAERWSIMDAGSGGTAIAPMIALAHRPPVAHQEARATFRSVMFGAQNEIMQSAAVFEIGHRPPPLAGATHVEVSSTIVWTASDMVNSLACGYPPASNFLHALVVGFYRAQTITQQSVTLTWNGQVLKPIYQSIWDGAVNSNGGNLIVAVAQSVTAPGTAVLTSWTSLMRVARIQIHPLRCTVPGTTAVAAGGERLFAPISAASVALTSTRTSGAMMMVWAGYAAAANARDLMPDVPGWHIISRGNTPNPTNASRFSIAVAPSAPGSTFYAGAQVTSGNPNLLLDRALIGAFELIPNDLPEYAVTLTRAGSEYDVTEDVVSVRISRDLATPGRDLRAGVADIELGSTLGEYMPTSGSVWRDMLRPATAVQIDMAALDASWSMFRGVIDQVAINPEIGAQTINIGARDISDKLFDRNFTAQPASNTTVQSFLSLIFSSSNVPSSAWIIEDPIPLNLPFAWTRERSLDRTLRQIRDVANVAMWTDPAGKLHVTDAGWAMQRPTVETLTEFRRLALSMDWDDVLNVARVRGTPQLVDDAVSIIGRLDQSIVIPSGESRTFWLEHVDPVTSERVAAIDVRTPIAVLDYRIVDYANAFRHEEVEIDFYAFAESSKIVAKNNSEVDVTVTRFELRGRFVRAGQTISVEEEDQESIEVYGRKQQVIETDFLTDRAALNARAKQIVADARSGVVRYSATVANKAFELRSLDLASQVHLIEPSIGLDTPFTLLGVEHNIQASRDGWIHAIAMDLRQSFDNEVLVLDDPERGVLDHRRLARNAGAYSDAHIVLYRRQLDNLLFGPPEDSASQPEPGYLLDENGNRIVIFANVPIVIG